MIKPAAVAMVLLALGLGGPLRAAGASAQPLTPVAAADPDVYYAPEENGDASGEMGASQGAVGSLPDSASYLSQARIVPFEWGHPGKPLDGVEIFLSEHYLGVSPLKLDGYMVQRDSLGLSARKEGYEEAVRARVRVPREGDLRVALLNENAASWYTTPAWVVGLGLALGGVLAYNSQSSNGGLSLLGAGVGVIIVTQLGARFFHLPALRRDVDAYNQSIEPAP